MSGLAERATSSPVAGLDGVTFEIIRHRLWSINEEAAVTLKLVSGSTLATEVHDMNTTILDATGNSLFVAPYMIVQAIAMQAVVQDILEHYGDNPGIHDGDMFLCNDPYVGALHQMDAVVAAPIHWGGRLVAFSACMIHQVDLGGPVPGQVQVGAKDIYGEQPLIPPVKIVEAGTLRGDIERHYLRHSRVPDLVALDLRAKIAANNVTAARVVEVVRKYGPEKVTETMARLADLAETKFRARLRELPNGIWRHRSYLEYEGDIYTGVCAMRKSGESLTFDFRGSSRQAPAVINMCRPALVADVVASVLIYLGWDLPWCPAGILRPLEIVSEPGTFLHAQWPAGVSKSTTSASKTAMNLANVCLGRMLASSPALRDHAMANWLGSNATEEIFGIDQRGEAFGGTLLDAYYGGGGARTFADGIDTGGYPSSIYALGPNVEGYEHRYPILYLFRRHQPDSGGAGKFRGGAGISLAYIPHGAERIATKIMHTCTAGWSEAVGICGGFPSQSNQFGIRRGTDVRERLGRGEVPQDPEALGGSLEVTGPITRTSLEGDDVFFLQGECGGGYGDPLERDPARVASDLQNGLVSAAAAKDTYGVVVAADGMVDTAATHALRLAKRDARRRSALHVMKEWPVGGGGRGDVNEFLTIALDAAGHHPVYHCRCGHALGPANRNYKAYLLMEEGPLFRAGPRIDPFRVANRFVFRRYHCPHCLLLHEAETALDGEGVLWEAELLP